MLHKVRRAPPKQVESRRHARWMGWVRSSPQSNHIHTHTLEPKVMCVMLSDACACACDNLPISMADFPALAMLHTLACSAASEPRMQPSAHAHRIMGRARLTATHRVFRVTFKTIRNGVRTSAHAHARTHTRACNRAHFLCVERGGGTLTNHGTVTACVCVCVYVEMHCVQVRACMCVLMRSHATR